MKTILLTVVSAVFCAVTVADSFGQAQVSFENTGFDPVTYAYGYGPAGGGPIFGSAGTWEFGLYMGALGATSISQMQLVDTALSVAATSSSAAPAGIIPGGTVNTPGNV